MAKKSKTKEIEKEFSLFASDDVGEKAQEALARLSTKTKKAGQLMSLEDVPDEFLAFDKSWFVFQAAVGQLGIKQRGLTEIIGTDGVGKTSMAFAMAGQMMKNHNCPVLYLETESKKMDKKRIERCLSPDVELSKKMIKSLHYMFVSSLVDCIYQLESWAIICRNELGVPMEVPLFIIIDSYSKLQNQAESEGRTGYDQLSDSQKSQVARFIVGEASMKDKLGHAAVSQQWGRALPRFCKDYNVSILTINHQNTSISTAPSFLSPEASAAYNRTKIGGNALNQNAALQFTLLRKNYVKQGDVKVADRCRGTIVKNSYGQKASEFGYDVSMTTQEMYDCGIHLPAISFERVFSEWMASPASPFKVDETRKRYSMESKGWTSKHPLEFAHLCWSDTEIMEAAYKHIGITPSPFEPEVSRAYQKTDSAEVEDAEG